MQRTATTAAHKVKSHSASTSAAYNASAASAIFIRFLKRHALTIMQATPKGVFVTTTVVVQFHPRVLTKVDRALKVQCFYMEADKTVSSELEVRCASLSLPLIDYLNFQYGYYRRSYTTGAHAYLPLRDS